MISEGFLKAERALAQHSSKLAVRVPEPDELAVTLAALAPRFARALAEALRPLLGGDLAEVTCGKVEKAVAPRLHKLIDPVAVNLLMQDAAGAQLLASLDYPSALVLTDQVFGGPGEAPPQLPDRLPAATDLTMSRFAAVLGEALGMVLDRPAALTLAARSEVLGKLVRARDDDVFLTLRCQVSLAGKTPWALLLVIRQSQALLLLAEGGAPARVIDETAPPTLDEPFASLPLELVAVLAEIVLPVSRISTLKPGDTLALAIPAELPLRLADITLARGQAGMADGAMALRLTHISLSNEGLSQDDR